jgi:phospholipid/cholesterol/gamma-HCH transport system substrate-binding protein
VSTPHDPDQHELAAPPPVTESRRLSRRKRLALAWTRLRTVPGMFRDVAALVVVAALGLAALGVILSNEDVRWPWQPDRFTFRVELADAVAVNPSKNQEVRIAGVVVGSIVGSTPTARGTSYLTLAVDRDAPVYDNAQVVLRPENPLNQMYIELSPGGPPGRPLPADGLIPIGQTRRPVQAEEILDKLDDRSRHALTMLLSESDVALADGPRTVPVALREATGTLTSVRPLAEALAARRAKIATLVSSFSQIAGAVGGNDQRLTALMNSTQATLDVLARGDGKLQSSLAALPGATDALRSSLNEVTALTGELNPAVRNLRAAADDLPPALDKLHDVVDDVGDVLPAAREVVDRARPVLADLNPVIGDVSHGLRDIGPFAHKLGPATRSLVPGLDGVSAFFYNNTGIFQPSDAHGGWGRGQLDINVSSPFGNAHRGGSEK